MGYEEKYNTTNAKNVVNNFKTKEDHRNLQTKFGTNMSGKDKPLKISKKNTTRERIGSEK